MSRQIKWRLQFTSLNGTGCLVNVYETGYNGSGLYASGKTGADVPFAVENGVTELVGAADPFSYDEDDSMDMLSFLRYKTGYLRVMEMEYGALDALQPNSMTHHYVEAYYGTERVFTGFMQCDEYDNAWVASPRELSFPVVSPLGLLSAYHFEVPDNHGLTNLGYWMREVMVRLNPKANDSTDSDYSQVVYPGKTLFPWDGVIRSTTLCPFNEGFNHYDANSAASAANLIWSPKTFAYFIEGICASNGWMLHDTPDALVFMKYELARDQQSGTSLSALTVEGLSTLTGRTNVSQYIGGFGAFYSNHDNDARQTTLRPLKSISLDLEGVGSDPLEMTTKYTIVSSSQIQDVSALSRYVTLQQIGPNVSSDILNVATWTGANEIYNTGLFPISYGKWASGDTSFSMSEFFVLKYDSSWTGNTVLLHATFYGRVPTNSQGRTLLRLKASRGNTISTLAETWGGSQVFNIVIKRGSQYYALGPESWVNNLTKNPVEIRGNIGGVNPNKSLSTYYDIDDCDGLIINYGLASVEEPIEVFLYLNTTSSFGLTYLAIRDLSFNSPSNQYVGYSSYYEDKSNITLGGSSVGVETANVAVNLHSEILHQGNNSYGQNDGNLANNLPVFTYMFFPMNFLTQRVKRTSASVNFNEYAAMWNYWISGWRWRMIAKSFRMVDDEYRVILAHSTVLDNLQ